VRGIEGDVLPPEWSTEAKCIVYFSESHGGTGQYTAMVFVIKSGGMGGGTPLNMALVHE
jgi:hypothetical protein